MLVNHISKCYNNHMIVGEICSDPERSYHMIFKRLFCLLLVLAMLMCMTACSNNEAVDENGDAVVAYDETEETKPLLPTSSEEIVAIYNKAVSGVLDADNYTMTGSANSVSELDNIVTSVVTSVDCKYVNGDTPSMRMISTVSYDDMENTHDTYFDGSKYYYDDGGSKFTSFSNDYADYNASDYFKTLEASQIYNHTMQWLPDDSGYTISFDVILNDLQSVAIDGTIGMLSSEDVYEKPVHLSVDVDLEGNLLGVYIEFSSEMPWDQSIIYQQFIASLTFSDVNNTVVEIPDFDTYEDTAVAPNPDGIGQNPGDHNHDEEINPEDVE